MWFPYGGFPIRHDTSDQNWQSAIGLATTRLDGFAAWRAGAEKGELTTQPFACVGDRLFVNADASRGSVAIEVLDESGVVVKGLEADACRPIKTDTLAQGADGWVHWNANDNLKAVRGKKIRLRFILKDADLFSFRIANAETMRLPVPRATSH